MGNFGKVYLVDKDAKIEHAFTAYEDFEIDNVQNCHGRYEVLKNKKQICVLHTGDNMRMINLPYSFVSMKGVYLSNNKMFYHVRTTQKELFLDNDLNLICECDKLGGLKYYNVRYKDDFLTNNKEFNDKNIPLLIAIGNTDLYKIIIDLVNRKIVFEEGRIVYEKDRTYYYIEDVDKFGYLYNIKAPGTLKELGRQEFERGGVKMHTFVEIEIDGNKYYSYKTIGGMGLLDSSMNEVKIDTKDISFVYNMQYADYHPENRYICVDNDRKFQICEFTNKTITPIGQKYKILTYTWSGRFLQTKEEDSLDTPFNFINWDGEQIKGITGNVVSEDTEAGRLNIVLALYKTEEDTKKYAGYHFYDNDFHIATEYYASMTREYDSAGSRHYYKCETFDGNVIIMDEGFNVKHYAKDVIEKVTKYPTITVALDTKEKHALLKHRHYQQLITADIPYNYSEIILPRWRGDKDGIFSLIVRTDDGKSILYSSVNGNNYEMLCDMDNIAYGDDSNYYYVCNKSEEYPVRLVKIKKDNKLVVNRHKLKSIFIDTAYPNYIYYFDGEDVGRVYLKDNKIVFDNNIYYTLWKPLKGELIDGMQEVEPDIYFIDKDDNIIKREDV